MPETGRILDECPGCHRRGIRHRAYGVCAMCYSRIRRARLTPDELEREREYGRAWRRRQSQGYWLTTEHKTEQFLPTTDIFCWNCGIQMVLPDSSGLCGFCKIEMPAWEKIMAYEFPESDKGWVNLFETLPNDQLLELKEKTNLEIIRRTGLAIEKLLPNMTRLYRTNGKPPAHHQNPQLNLFGTTEET